MPYDYLPLDRKSAVPLYRQLYLSIRGAAESGRLKAGDRLPSVRRMAADLGLSCTTVESAYQQLCVEGYLRARPHRGYFVRDVRRDVFARPAPPAFRRRAAPAVRYDFGTGCVDGEAVDLKAWRRNVRGALNRRDVLASYGEKQGETELREALAAYGYQERGLAASPGQIVVGAGTQPLLFLLCGLLDRGAVAMEEPGFRQAEQVFSDCGFSVLKLPGDSDGIRMDALESSGAKLLFVSPSSRALTGAVLPMSRRLTLLKWAKANGGFVIEDDYNGELRYRARPVPAMQGIAGGRGVVYLGSFSKLLLPSVRIGYMALPPELLARYRPRAANYNQTASKVEQLALAEYIRSGQMERHLRRLRKRYGAKSEALVRALRGAFPGAGVLLRETPLTVALTLKTGKSARELCALALARGVRVQPDEGGGVLLGFAGIPPENIPGAVECLRQAWRGC